MKERPILFSAPMVRAILDGSKTQTRRVVKMPKIWERQGGKLDANSTFRDQGFGDGEYLHVAIDDGSVQRVYCPYGQRGDQLWVRETWQGPLLDSDEQEAQFDEDGPDAFKKPGFCAYRATDDLDAVDEDGKDLGWRPSIHMPRWASRIQLEITGVRVERLQDISEQDAWAEGCEGYDDDVTGGQSGYGEFVALWEAINGPGSWEANPWVWVIEFRRIRL